MTSASPVLRVNSKWKSLSDAWIGCRGFINTPSPGQTCTGHCTLPLNRDPRHFRGPQRKPRLKEDERFRGSGTWQDKDRLSHLPFAPAISTHGLLWPTQSSYVLPGQFSKTPSLLLQWLNHSSKWQTINAWFKCIWLPPPQNGDLARGSTYSFPINDRNAKRTWGKSSPLLSGA